MWIRPRTDPILPLGNPSRAARGVRPVVPERRGRRRAAVQGADAAPIAVPRPKYAHRRPVPPGGNTVPGEGIRGCRDDRKYWILRLTITRDPHTRDEPRFCCHERRPGRAPVSRQHSRLDHRDTPGELQLRRRQDRCSQAAFSTGDPSESKRPRTGRATHPRVPMVEHFSAKRCARTSPVPR
jgi:hypothetical protein